MIVFILQKNDCSPYVYIPVGTGLAQTLAANTATASSSISADRLLLKHEEVNTFIQVENVREYSIDKNPPHTFFTYKGTMLSLLRAWPLSNTRSQSVKYLHHNFINYPLLEMHYLQNLEVLRPLPVYINSNKYRWYIEFI